VAVENQVVISISDWRRMVRELNKIEPNLSSALRDNVKEIGEPVRDAVRDSIPSSPPLRGMQRKLSPVGLTWNTRRQARAVAMKYKSPPKTSPTSLTGRNAAILQLQIKSPAAIIADMAGRGNASIKGQKTRFYTYPRAKSGQRRHTVTSQGDIMIEKLGGTPSRYVYPGAEKAMPEAAQKLDDFLGYVTQEIERRVNG